MSSNKPKTPYFSNGQALQSPPLTVRASRFAESVYNFLGLYVVSFFSLDPYAAAQNSQFNIHRPRSSATPRSRWGGGSSSSSSWGPGGGGGGGGGGSGPGSGPGRRIGRVDDVRGPECGSCR